MAGRGCGHGRGKKYCPKKVSSSSKSSSKLPSKQSTRKKDHPHPPHLPSGDESVSFMVDMYIIECGTLKCENAAICEKVAKCEKNSTLNVKIDAICEKITLNVKK